MDCAPGYSYSPIPISNTGEPTTTAITKERVHITFVVRLTNPHCTKEKSKFRTITSKKITYKLRSRRAYTSPPSWHQWLGPTSYMYNSRYKFGMIVIG